MTVITMATLAGSPGVTTAVCGLAVYWPRPVILVEADTSAASTVMAGFLRSNLPTTAGGIEKLAFAASRGALEPEDVLDPAQGLAIPVHDLAAVPTMPIPALPDGHRMWVIPGFVHLSVIDGVRSLWSRLPRLFDTLGQGGFDVIVDLGRLGVEDARLPLIDTADKVVICASSSMIDLNRVYRRLELPDLASRAREAGTGRYVALLTEPAAEKLSAREFTTHVLPVLASLPHDPRGAAVFSHGSPDPKPSRNAYRAAIRRAARDLQQLTDRVEQRSAS